MSESGSGSVSRICVEIFLLGNNFFNGSNIFDVGVVEFSFDLGDLNVIKSKGFLEEAGAFTLEEDQGQEEEKESENGNE